MPCPREEISKSNSQDEQHNFFSQTKFNNSAKEIENNNQQVSPFSKFKHQ